MSSNEIGRPISTAGTQFAAPIELSCRRHAERLRSTLTVEKRLQVEAAHTLIRGFCPHFGTQLAFHPLEDSGVLLRSGPPFPRPGWLPLPSHSLCEEPARALCLPWFHFDLRFQIHFQAGVPRGDTPPGAPRSRRPEVLFARRPFAEPIMPL